MQFTVKLRSARVFAWIALVTFLTVCYSTAHGQQKVTLKDVKVTGNARVEDDGIRLHLKSRAGESFDSKTVEQDVKAIYRMGFFEDVQAELSPDGILTYAVKEKPYVREVKIQGAAQVTREKDRDRPRHQPAFDTGSGKSGRGSREGSQALHRTGVC